MMRKINYIVIHHTAVDQKDMAKLIKSINISHKQRWLHKTADGLGYYIAYHYIIGMGGDIKQTRFDSEVWYHASNLKINKESLGISLVGNLDKHPPTTDQIIVLWSLINDIKNKYGQHIKIVYHNMYSKKTCPGKLFPYALFDKFNTMVSKFKEVFLQEVKDPIFTVHDDNTPATVWDAKYLMEIGVARTLKKIYTYIDSENKKDRSFIDKILSFLKLK